VRRAATKLGILLALAVATLPACYAGTARDVSPQRIASDPSWQTVRDVPFVRQHQDLDCGAAAVAMVLAYWRVPATDAEMAELARLAEAEGIRAGTLRDLARRKGLEAFVVSGTPADIADQLARGRPVLVGLAKPLSSGRAVTHYEVVVGINRARHLILTLDPARGMRENTYEGFAREWVPTKQVTVVIFREATPAGAPGPNAQGRVAASHLSMAARSVVSPGTAA
jgi:ABC-type bacteriocin/lantibiotic exporter with double-glycine peptidase domain